MMKIMRILKEYMYIKIIMVKYIYTHIIVYQVMLIIMNCSGIDKYIIETGEIKGTQRCDIKYYEDYNYIKEQKIKEKLKNDKVIKEVNGKL